MAYDLRKPGRHYTCDCGEPLFAVYINYPDEDTGALRQRRVKVRICLACEKFVKEE